MCASPSTRSRSTCPERPQGRPATPCTASVSLTLDLATRDVLTLPLSKKTLQGFTRRAPEPSRDPPPMQTNWLAAEHFATVVPAPVGWQAAVLMLLAVDGCLRPSEALALRARVFLLQHRARLGLAGRS
jgi:hypothetical protein